MTRDKKGVFRRETGLNLAQNSLKTGVLEYGKIGHLRCPNVLLAKKIMIREASTNSNPVVTSRGWDALEMKLKEKGLSSVEIREAHKSFNEGIELMSRMFLNCYDLEKKQLV